MNSAFAEYGRRTERTSQNCKGFITAKVRPPEADGDALFVNVIAFSSTTGAALLALDDGDSVALCGTLTPKVWTDKEGNSRPALDMVAHVAQSPYQVKRKRQTTDTVCKSAE